MGNLRCSSNLLAGVPPGICSFIIGNLGPEYLWGYTMIEHLSYSSISAYLSCAASWQFKYIEHIKTPPAVELSFGSAFHATVEQFVGGEHKADLIGLWADNWSKQIEKDSTDFGIGSPNEYFNIGVRLFTDDNVRRGILSIRADKDTNGPKLERYVELRVPGVPIPVVGYIDIIAVDHVPCDFKTSARAWTSDKALNEVQPLFYLAALNQAGIETPDFRFRHYVFVKTKTPQFQAIEHTHNPAQLGWLFGMIRKVWEGIEREVFPENPTGWKCSPDYCEFWHLCRGRYE